MGRTILILIVVALASPAPVQAEHQLNLELGNWTAGVAYDTRWGAFG